jgi:hypothetical protein
MCCAVTRERLDGQRYRRIDLFIQLHEPLRDSCEGNVDHRAGAPVHLNDSVQHIAAPSIRKGRPRLLRCARPTLTQTKDAVLARVPTNISTRSIVQRSRQPTMIEVVHREVRGLTSSHIERTCRTSVFVGLADPRLRTHPKTGSNAQSRRLCAKAGPCSSG